MLRKRPCSFCRRWFHPDPRVGDRQFSCSSESCQSKRRAETQASWRARNRDYFAARRIQKRRENAGERVPEPMRVPAPLDQLPWDVAQDEFGAQGADFIGILGRLLVDHAQDQSERQVRELIGKSPRHPLRPAKDQSGATASSVCVEDVPP